MDNLINVVEAILFASGVPLRRQEILDKMPGITKKKLDNVIEKLKEQYSGKCGIRLEIFNDKIQFSSNSDYGEIVADVLQPVKEKELSKILVEVLSIIAYQQPITRSEIEDIRGVSPDYAIGVLLKADLIKSCGFKQAPGKPILYGTTEEFLKKFELESLDKLPDYAEVMNRLIQFGNYNIQTEGLYKDIQLADDFEDSNNLTSNQIQQMDELDSLLDSNPDFIDDSDEMFVVESNDDEVENYESENKIEHKVVNNKPDDIDPDEGSELGV